MTLAVLLAGEALLASTVADLELSLAADDDRDGDLRTGRRGFFTSRL